MQGAEHCVMPNWHMVLVPKRKYYLFPKRKMLSLETVSQGPDAV